MTIIGAFLSNIEDVYKNPKAPIIKIKITEIMIPDEPLFSLT
jgi:hypothetical protein